MSRIKLAVLLMFATVALAFTASVAEAGWPKTKTKVSTSSNDGQGRHRHRHGLFGNGNGCNGGDAGYSAGNGCNGYSAGSGCQGGGMNASMPANVNVPAGQGTPAATIK